jgi:hypothetical protein
VTTAAITSLAAALPAGGGDRTAPRAPEVFYGVLPQSERPQAEFHTMKRGGVDSVRFPISWDAVERAEGVYDFSSVDRYVEPIARARMEIFPAIMATPTFYGVNCAPGDCFRSLPSQTARQKAAWKEFLRRIVGRYGPRGSFWTQHPGVPKRPIRVYQIWNEENFIFFTEPRSPKLYAELVRVSRQAIKSRDRGARIILGGLFGHPRRSQGLQAATFLNRLYRIRGIEAHFAGVALHPYSRDASELGPDIRAIRRVMRRHGDARAGLYLTEIGWGSARDTAFEKGPRGQVRELTQAFNIVRRMQRSARIRRVFWFSWEDHPTSCNFCDSTGLWTANAASPKPSWFRYRAFALNRR